MGIQELKLSQTLDFQECIKTNLAENDFLAGSQRIRRRIICLIVMLAGSILPTLWCKYRERPFSMWGIAYGYSKWEILSFHPEIDKEHLRLELSTISTRLTQMKGESRAI